MESKEFYGFVIAVIDYIMNGHPSVTKEIGEKLSGCYWPRITQLFIDGKAGFCLSRGDFQTTQGQNLNSIYQDCLHAIKKIEQEESDRKLDNAAKAYGIKHAKRAFVVSVVAIILSAISIIWQILGSIL